MGTLPNRQLTFLRQITQGEGRSPKFVLPAHLGGMGTYQLPET